MTKTFFTIFAAVVFGNLTTVAIAAAVIDTINHAEQTQALVDATK